MSISYSICSKDQNLEIWLRTLISEFRDMQLLAVETNFHSALNNSLKLSNDLVFIDLDTFPRPYKLVREFKQYKKENTNFIALSRTKKHAYKAMKNHFKDYLLLPLTEVEIRKSILHFINNRPKEKATNICLKSKKDFQYLRADEIVFLKADNNTTDFHMSNGKVITSMKTLKKFEKNLPPEFLRIHRSFIVNSNFVIRIDFSRSLCHTRKNFVKIPFTKSFNNNILTLNSMLSQTTAISIN